MISKFGNNTEGLSALKYGRTIAHGFIMSFNNSTSLDKYNHSIAHRNLVNMFKEDIESKKVVDFEDVEFK